MSGSKRARARLSRENQVRLENELRESRRVGDAVAEVANVAHQARAVVRELGPDARRYMGAIMAGLEARLSTFERQRGELESELAEIAVLSSRTPSGAIAAEASARRAQAEKRLATLTERAKEIRSAADSIAGDLDSKKNEDLRERVRRGRARSELEGLRAELERRRLPTSLCSLERVTPETGPLLKDLDELLDDHRAADSIDAGTVAFFRARLSKLVEDAAKIDQLEAERQAIADLLDRTLRGIGMIRREYGGDSGPGGPIEYRFPQRETAQLALIRLSIPLSGEITVEMLGLGDAGNAALSPDADCRSKLERIVQEARKRGLDFQAAGIRNRDPSTGALRSREGSADGAPQHAEARHRERPA